MDNRAGVMSEGERSVVVYLFASDINTARPFHDLWNTANDANTTLTVSEHTTKTFNDGIISQKSERGQ